MNTVVNRREFIQKTAVIGAAAAAASVRPLRAQNAASRKIVVGVMGLGRGMAHVNGFLSVPNVEVAYICDVDERRMAAGLKTAAGKQSRTPLGVKDFRVILQDPNVDILSIAAPNFWHAPATILACAAGKHVYVEKPGSHNAREAELMAEAARKHDRLVQLGTQRRSMPWLIEAVEKLKAGEIGRVLYARCWYNNARSSIGKGKPAPVPDWLDYSLWQGPVPERPYMDNLVHYNWHWMWHWGGGELANNGVHALDIARWGLGVDYPITVSYVAGRYHYNDDQETPDTGVATYDFGGRGAMWDGSSCHPRKAETTAFIHFYGENGSLAVAGNGYTIYDMKGAEVHKQTGSGSDVPHYANLVDAIRQGTKLNAPIEDGHKSALLCHLGNIAWRMRRTIHFDPVTRKIVGEPDAEKFWGRAYRPGWEPKV